MIAIAALWYLAARPLGSLDAAPASPSMPPVIENALPAVAGVDAYEPARKSTPSTRNLFGYVEPPPVIVETPPPAYVPVVAPPLVVDPVPQAPPPPRFEYRYIGRFGPERDPIAAFTANGEVITVRRGEKIGARFVLRTIGLESVEVADGQRIVRIAME